MVGKQLANLLTCHPPSYRRPAIGAGRHFFGYKVSVQGHRTESRRLAYLFAWLRLHESTALLITYRFKLDENTELLIL